MSCFFVVQSQFNALTLPEKLTLLVHAIGNDQSVEVSLYPCLKGLYREGGTDILTIVDLHMRAIVSMIQDESFIRTRTMCTPTVTCIER